MNNKKYVNLLFLAGGAVTWLLAQHYVRVLTGRFQLSRHIGANRAEFLEHSLPIILGVAVFIFLRRNTKSYTFSTNAMTELSRVQWPKSNEVRMGTIVVIVTVLLAGLFLGFLDLGINAVIKAILGA